MKHDEGPQTSSAVWLLHPRRGGKPPPAVSPTQCRRWLAGAAAWDTETGWGALPTTRVPACTGVTRQWESEWELRLRPDGGEGKFQGEDSLIGLRGEARGPAGEGEDSMDTRPARVKIGRRDRGAADAPGRGLRTRRPQGAIRVTGQDGTAPGEGQDLREAGTQGHGRDGDFLLQKGKRGERGRVGVAAAISGWSDAAAGSTPGLVCGEPRAGRSLFNRVCLTCMWGLSLAWHGAPPTTETPGKGRARQE